MENATVTIYPTSFLFLQVRWLMALFVCNVYIRSSCFSRRLKQENSWLSSEKVRLTDELSSLKQKSFERHEKLKSHQVSV